MSSRVDQISRYRIPGVHIDFQTQDKVEVFKTGIPVFIGFGRLSDLTFEPCQMGWCRITSWKQFETSVITPSYGYLRSAVQGFFENGGVQCVIVPIPLDEGSKPDINLLTKPFTDVDVLGDQINGNKSTGNEGVLEDIENIDLVCVPDLMLMDNLESKDCIVKAQQLILQHCKKMGDRFAILDMPLKTLHIDSMNHSQHTFINIEELDEIIKYRYQISGSEGAIYFPWICVSSDDGQLKSIPPCGHLAGIYARSDARIGVFKAPANEPVEGAFDLSISFTTDQQTELNHAGVNCFKSFPNRGVRVWGARTLSAFQHDQYVSVRRLFLTLVRWIERNTRDLIFETNDASIRKQIKFRLEGFCYQLFEKGALKGKNPEEAYYVKCDQELNGHLDWDSGKVISEIALAPIVPAEFIIVRITKSVDRVLASELLLN